MPSSLSRAPFCQPRSSPRASVKLPHHRRRRTRGVSVNENGDSLIITLLINYPVFASLIRDARRRPSPPCRVTKAFFFLKVGVRRTHSRPIRAASIRNVSLALQKDVASPTCVRVTIVSADTAQRVIASLRGRILEPSGEHSGTLAIQARRGMRAVRSHLLRYSRLWSHCCAALQTACHLLPGGGGMWRYSWIWVGNGWLRLEM